MQYLIRHIKLRWTKQISVLLLLVLCAIACVEPFEDSDFEERFEDVLVVSSTITNELKHQEVILTRSFRFDEEQAGTEENANVWIADDQGNEYYFEEDTPGKYLSVQPFNATMGRKYVLNVSTQNGDSYSSDEMELPVANTSIDEVYAERITTDNNEDGVSIFVDTFDPSGNSRYYRHEFVETFKIIAPYWSPYDAVVISEGISSFDIAAILREQEERICYGENTSKSVLVASTAGLSEDRLDQYQVRFINRDNYILSYRYSVLVRQYAVSKEAFSYYEALSGLSQDADNVFSEDQPGFLPGNIRSITNPKENVVGYFDVAAADEKRIFFNYTDFFPGEELPSYAVDCVLSAPLTEGSLGERELLNLIYDDVLRFYDFNFGTMPGGPFIMVRKECGDCTTLGSNDVPEFWIE